MNQLGQKFWEKYFKVYDVLNIVVPYQELMAELEGELDLQQNDVVLDVGSGTGNLMMRIKGKCKEIVGIDYSEEGIKIHKSKDPLANAIFHNITEKFPFPDNYFTKIVSNNTIYALNRDQQFKTASEIHRVLRQGGKFVISNVIKGFSPIKIYIYHAKKMIKRQGLLKTIILIFQLIIPTIKMFYYNWKIKKSGIAKQYNFFSQGQQKYFLQKSGFMNVSDEKFIFANQAITNNCYK